MGINEVVQIGNRIKEYRKSKGITQKELALRADIPYSTYSNYENNNREPNREQLQKIATALDVPLYELMGFDGSIRVNENVESERLDEEAQKIFIRQESGEKITEEAQIVSDYIERTQGDYDKLSKSVNNLTKVIKRYLNENTQIPEEIVQVLKESIQRLTELTSTMPNSYENLNDIGREKAAEQIDMLTKIPEYQKNPPQD